MKIAICTETYLPYINGVVTHIKALKEGLEKRGHQVLIVTADPNVKKHVVKDNVLYCPAVRMSKKRMYGYGLANPFSKKRRQFIKDFAPDVMHIHQEFTIGLWGARTAKKLHIPAVSTVHTMYDDYIYYVAFKPFIPFVRWFSHKYFKMILKNSKEITGPSAKSQAFIEECGLHNKVHVFPNPVELDLFKPGTVSADESKALRKKLNIPENKTVVCFVGRLGKEKNVDTLLTYWSQNISSADNLHLLVCGGGPVYDELVNQAKSLHISDMCSFPGAIQHEELNPFFSISKCYITASLSDTNSISMKEGMAAGLPVIHITDEMNQGQIVDGVNGFVYKNGEEMAENLRKIRDMSPEQYHSLQTSVLNHVQQFSDVALADNLLSIYTQALRS